MNSKQKFRANESNHHLDILISGLLVSGVLLVMTETPLKVLVRNIYYPIGIFFSLVKGTGESAVQMIQRMEFSDLMGMLLILIASGMLLRRIRDRILLNSPDSIYCPDCSQKLHRIHRSHWQRIVSKLLNLSSEYYHCDGCGQSSIHFHKQSDHLT